MLNYRVVIFSFALIFGVVFSIPSLTQSDAGKKITLGLDLQGGLHMLLGVKTEEAVTSHIKSVAATTKYILDEQEIIFDELRINDDLISFEILDKDDLLKTKEIIGKEVLGIVLTENNLKFSLKLTPEEIIATEKNAIAQAVDTIRNRLDMFGLAEPTVAKQGKDKILVEVPGIKTAEDEQRIRELIGRSAVLQMMAVDEDRDSRVLTMSNGEAKNMVM